MANSPPPKTWRDMLPVHPAADLFPAMSETELRELGEDIKANGLRSPIILWSPGDQLEKDAKEFLLDGRNRLDAMELVGMETVSKSKDGKLSGFLGGSNSLRGTHRAPIVRLHEFVAGHALSLGGRTAGLGKEFREPDTDPYVFVLSANIHRRHLTAEQKRDLIEKLLKARPQSSDRAIAKQTKVDNKTVAKVRAKLEGREEIPHFEARTDTKGRKQPSTKPKKPSKPALPAETEPIGSSPVRHSEVPATSVSPESRSRSVSARDIALEGFSAHSMELVRLTRNKGAERFAKTALSDENIKHLAKLFFELDQIRRALLRDARPLGTALDLLAGQS